MHFLGVVSPVHDIAQRFMEFVTFFQEMKCVVGIMNPAFRYHESGNDLLIDIDNDRGFQEMFSDLSGSFRVIMAAVSTGEAR